MRWFSFAVMAGITLMLPQVASADSWPQFRGSGGKGGADGEQKLPAEIGPEQSVVWKVPMPPGHSSPIVYGDRIYLPAVRGKALVPLGIDRHSGKIVWEAEAPYKQLEKIHQIGSHAQST